jgi:hypothetical protein
MLSSEDDTSEKSWSVGTYMTPVEVRDAFGLSDAPTRPRGVAPHQPWPWAGEAGRVYSSAGLVLGVLFLAFVAFLLAGGRVVLDTQVPIPPRAVPGSPEAAAFTEPFAVESAGNLEVRVEAPVDNSWLYLDGALINEETGAMDEFDVEVEYYHGSDSDGAWTEGGTSARRYVASVPSGRYVLRLAPQWEAARGPAAYHLRVRSRVARFHQVVFAALAVGAWPLVLLWKHLRFEMERWSESDHPWMETE